jgi:hypothetical protein
MRILPRPDARSILFVVLLCLMGYAPARAQVLAQRNWAGSGVTIEPWWRRAVFYRMDPETFQDSNGDGKGDLAGVTQRLDYLQSLGVDALILKNVSPTVEGFDDLTRAAVGSHVRVLVELGAPASQSGDAAYVAEARQWLNQGAAGLYVPTGLLQKVDGAGHIALLLHQLRAVTDSFPGGRVLLADAPTPVDQDVVTALAKETQLTASAPIAVAGSGSAAASLRTQLMADLGAAASAPAVAVTKPVASAPSARGRRGRRHYAAASRTRENNPLLVAARVPADMDAATKAGLERALAVMLLGSRSAVMLEYGEELGLDGVGTDGALMQWTPTNVTRKPEPPPEPVAAKPVDPSKGYEGFQSYIPPMRKDLFPPPKMPVVTESDEAVPVVIDPNTLPGFTAGTLDASLAAANGAAANVAMEQADPTSLLNLYRQLIQLHHDNPTVRNGAETVLDYDAVDAVVWVRRAIANSRTSAMVVGACNLSDKPVVLGDLGGVRVRGLRALVGVVDGETVAAGAVVVGELR